MNVWSLFLYSTISSSYKIFVKDETICQGVGICVNGSYILGMQYIDPEYCDYSKDCPRFYATSSLSNYIGYLILTYSGTLHSKHPSNLPSTYQRPARHSHDLIS